jgi:hypothetical protein
MLTHPVAGAFTTVSGAQRIGHHSSLTAFTGDGKLVRKATGYEQQKLKPRYPTSGSPAARAELPAPIGAYR